MFNISWGLQHISTHPLPFPLDPPYTLPPPPSRSLFRGCCLFPPSRYLFWDVIYVPITSYYLFWDVIYVPITLSFLGRHLCSHHAITLPVASIMPSRCLFLPSCHHVACSFHHAITLPVPSITSSVPSIRSSVPPLPAVFPPSSPPLPSLLKTHSINSVY